MLKGGIRKYKNWLVEWLALYVKPTTKIRTYKKYQRQIELHIIPALGEFEVQDLTATVLQRFTVDLSEKGLSANTVNGIISVLKSSLRRAVLLGVTDKEFTMAIVRPKQRESRLIAFLKKNNEKSSSLSLKRRKISCSAWCFVFTLACVLENFYPLLGMT